MKKSKRQKNAELVLAILDSNKYGYEILNRNKKKVPNHVRVAGWGDIWPTTFTFLKNGKWTRNNPEALFDALADHNPVSEDVLRSSYTKSLAELNSLIPEIGMTSELESFCKAQLKKAGYLITKKPK